MSEYLKKLMKLMDISEEDNNGMMVVNRDGIVEYYRPGKTLSAASFFPDFGEKVTGKYVVDLYPELTEENSTVMETLRTGKTISGAMQTFTWQEHTVTMQTTTYPIMEGGRIEGAVDVAKLLELKKDGVRENINSGLYTTDDIITGNNAMINLKEVIKDVAKNKSPVLIYGETGTGKELVAQSLHTESGRGSKPFISQNCAAIPENLLESIFFGTEKGGFTGAESGKGIFEMADGGTLFLDEINSMSYGMQAKLLKALEEQKIRRLGGRKDISFDVRVVCASNEDPEELVEQGVLRADLYYRIGVVKLVIPPLRKRPEDIPLLTEHFIRHYNRKMGRQIKGMNLKALELFSQWRWPGNVRELKNAVESAFNVEKGDHISLDSVQGFLRKSGGSRVSGFSDDAEDRPGLPEILFSREKLHTALEEGNVDLAEILEQCEIYILRETLNRERKLKNAAYKLSISPQKLQYRLDKLGLREPEKK
ncbi:MAG: sigma 54-interacting transcriptional regulator [Bacillota bacterium]|nr:sigma 54-interacting transcriptional regulator [Bacillota bacterium]